MILAGAGTGKTRVITDRIADMLGAGIPPASIVALSFTNKAAREMSARVKGLVGARAERVWLGTFHSFCLHILRRHAAAAGLAPGFALAGTADQLELVRKGLDERGWSGLYEAEKLHYQIGVAKNALLSPGEVASGQAKSTVHGDPAVLSAVYELYERQLKLNRVIDFDDCIFKTVRLLRENQEVRAALRRDFRYLMVDEYQDTNAAQLAVLELLASDSHDVAVVGDDDQSIYSWRGAMYEVLERFEQLFPGTKVIKLEQNYRCSNVILGAANTVIKNNARRKDKTLWRASKDTTPLGLSPCADDGAEARFVAEKCLSLLGAGVAAGDIAVLYRANNQAKALELALRETRIPYRTYGGQSFFERKEVKDFVSYLRLVLDPEDRLALWRVINTPQRGIGLKTLERVEADAVALRKSPFHVVKTATQPALAKFAALIAELSALPRETAADFEALGKAIIKLSGLETEIRVRTEDGASRERKLANLRSLPAWLATLAAERLEEDDGRIDEQALLDSLSLDAERKAEKDGPRDHVSLMTVHASKGLEFPAVFVVGLEEEQLPHKNSVGDPNALCEERRLFYVALTRAKQRLYLSYCLERSGGYQGKVARQPSRFLAELPDGAFVRDDAAASLETKAAAETDRKQRTARRLGALRESLRSPQ
jgi:superfamily I DNA/RNA helicase